MTDPWFWFALLGWIIAALLLILVAAYDNLVGRMLGFLEKREHKQ